MDEEDVDVRKINKTLMISIVSSSSEEEPFEKVDTELEEIKEEKRKYDKGYLKSAIHMGTQEEEGELMSSPEDKQAVSSVISPDNDGSTIPLKQDIRAGDSLMSKVGEMPLADANISSSDKLNIFPDDMDLYGDLEFPEKHIPKLEVSTLVYKTITKQSSDMHDVEDDEMDHLDIPAPQQAEAKKTSSKERHPDRYEGWDDRSSDQQKRKHPHDYDERHGSGSDNDADERRKRREHERTKSNEADDLRRKLLKKIEAERREQKERADQERAIEEHRRDVERRLRERLKLAEREKQRQKEREQRKEEKEKEREKEKLNYEVKMEIEGYKNRNKMDNIKEKRVSDSESRLKALKAADMEQMRKDLGSGSDTKATKYGVDEKSKKKKKRKDKDREKDREKESRKLEKVKVSPVDMDSDKEEAIIEKEASPDQTINADDSVMLETPMKALEKSPSHSPSRSLSLTPSPSPPPMKKRSYFPAIEGCRNVEEFMWLNRIEEGTYGVVYRAKDKHTNQIVALKRLKMEKEKEGFPITSLREINTLLKAQHPNIVTVREIVVGNNMDKIYIVMDYVEHDLKALMETMTNPFLVGEVKTLMIQLLSGVRHLHDNWILHRDIKASNLLLSHKGILKIGDFGLAREYGSPLKKYTSVVVTLWYRAPELLLGAKEYSTMIDLWSVGCVFAELLTMKPLFNGKSEIDQINRIFKELGTPNDKIWPGPPCYSEMPQVKKMNIAEHPYNILRQRFGASMTDYGFDLLNSFLTYDPGKRITSDGALKHKYFEENPLPVSPSMFPTWPAKSELGSRKTVRKNASPRPPEGGGQFVQMGDHDDMTVGFHMPATLKGSSVKGLGFNLKF